MSQVNYQATYKYLIVYILEMILWIRPCPGTRKCHPWRECSWRYAHNFLLLFQFSDVLYFCNNALGLAEVRLGKRNGHVPWTEDSRPSFSLFTLSANSFTFPTEPARKNSSENHTKRCFPFLWQRVPRGWLLQPLLPWATDARCQGPGLAREKASPSDPLRVTIVGFWLLATDYVEASL